MHLPIVWATHSSGGRQTSAVGSKLENFYAVMPDGEDPKYPTLLYGTPGYRPWMELPQPVILLEGNNHAIASHTDTELTWVADDVVPILFAYDHNSNAQPDRNVLLNVRAGNLSSSGMCGRDNFLKVADKKAGAIFTYSKDKGQLIWNRTMNIRAQGIEDMRDIDTDGDWLYLVSGDGFIHVFSERDLLERRMVNDLTFPSGSHIYSLWAEEGIDGSHVFAIRREGQRFLLTAYSSMKGGTTHVSNHALTGLVNPVDFWSNEEGSNLLVADKHTRNILSYRRSDGSRQSANDFTDLASPQQPLEPQAVSIGTDTTGTEYMAVITLQAGQRRTYVYADGVRATSPLTNVNRQDCCVYYEPAADANSRAKIWIYQVTSNLAQGYMASYQSDVGGGGNFTLITYTQFNVSDPTKVRGMVVEGTKGYLLVGREVQEYETNRWRFQKVVFRCSASSEPRGLHKQGDLWYVGEAEAPITRIAHADTFSAEGGSRTEHYKTGHICCYTATSVPNLARASETEEVAQSHTGEVPVGPMAANGTTVFMADRRAKGELLKSTYSLRDSNDPDSWHYGDFTSMARTDDGEGVTSGVCMDERNVWALDKDANKLFAYDHLLDERETILDIDLPDGMAVAAMEGDIIWVCEQRNRALHTEHTEVTLETSREEYAKKEGAVTKPGGLFSSLSRAARQPSNRGTYNNVKVTKDDEVILDHYYDGSDSSGFYINRGKRKIYFLRITGTTRTTTRYEYDFSRGSPLGGGYTRRAVSVPDYSGPVTVDVFDRYSKIELQAYNKRTGEREEGYDVTLNTDPFDETEVVDVETDGVIFTVLLIQAGETRKVVAYDAGNGQIVDVTLIGTGFALANLLSHNREGIAYHAESNGTNKWLTATLSYPEDTDLSVLLDPDKRDLATGVRMASHPTREFVSPARKNDITTPEPVYDLSGSSSLLYQATGPDGKILAYDYNTRLRATSQDKQIAVNFDGLKSLDGVWVFEDDNILFALDAEAKAIKAYTLKGQVRLPSRDIGANTDLFDQVGNTQPKYLYGKDEYLWVGDTGKNKLFAYHREKKTHEAALDINDLEAEIRGVAANEETMWVGKKNSETVVAYNLVPYGHLNELRRLEMRSNERAQTVELDRFNVYGIAVSPTHYWLSERHGHYAYAFDRPDSGNTFNGTRHPHTLSRSAGRQNQGGQALMMGLDYAERRTGEWYLLFVDQYQNEVAGRHVRQQPGTHSWTGAQYYINTGPGRLASRRRGKVSGETNLEALDSGVQALMSTDSVVYGKHLFGISSGRYFFDIQIGGGAGEDVPDDYDPTSGISTLRNQKMHPVSFTPGEAFTRPARMAFDGRYVMVVNSHKVYLYDLEYDTAEVLRRIDGPDYADDHGRYLDRKAWVDCTWVDGYFFLLAADGTFHHSFLNLPVFDQLDYDIAGTSPDDAVRVVAFRRRVYIFGRDSIEVWFNTGGNLTSTFAFQRDTSDSIPFGCISPDSVVVGEMGIFFLASDGIVKAIGGGHSYQTLSTEGVEEDIKGSRIEEARAVYYVDEGHQFYSLTLFPKDGSAPVNWTYDIKTALWHNRTRTNIMATTRLGGEVYVGFDDQDKIFTGRLAFGEDDGNAIQRVAQGPILHDNFRRLRLEHLQVDIPNPEGGAFEETDTILLEYSDDNGDNLNPISMKHMNQPRLRWNQLGQTTVGRHFRLTIRSNKPVVVLGTYLQAAQGKD